MHRTSNCLFVILLTLAVHQPAWGDGKIMLSDLQATENEKGQSHYYLGVFAYEDGEFEQAEAHLKNALAYNPDDPYFNHLSGRTHLKLEQYDQARTHLTRTWDVAPDTPGLKYDMAMLHYRLDDYPRAAQLFSRAAGEEPSNALAWYYAGLCLQHEKKYEQAIDHLTMAAGKSPTLKANCYYYIGVCNQKLGRTHQAMEKFEYVREHAESDALGQYAADWLRAMEEHEESRKPYAVFLKMGLQYDDNVRLAANQDVFADEDDFAFSSYFSGRYDFVDDGKFKLGAGGSLYNTSYYDLKDYDQTGAFFNLYTSYALPPVTLDFRYIPAYYWFDNKSFLIRHHFRPEATWRVSDELLTRVSYAYSENNYFQDDELDGHSHEAGLIVYYNVAPGTGYLFAEAGYEDTSASHRDYYYDKWRAGVGALVKGPWDVNMKISGLYDDKTYDHVDSYFGVRRQDDKYSLDMLIFRRFIWDWARILFEFNYTKNDSNIRDYSYNRSMGTLSIMADFQ